MGGKLLRQASKFHLTYPTHLYSVKDQSKPYDSEDPNFQSAEDFDIIDITDQDMMVPRNRERKDDVTLPTFYKVSIFF